MRSSKTIYLLNIGGYAPEITGRTYPYIYEYAEKIGAHVRRITQRRYPSWPVVYEKIQIGQLAKETKSDWNIYIDSDTLVHPECIDFTEFITKDIVLHNGADFANVRWKYDHYFRRDGRNIGSCNWFTISSDLTVEDLYTPLNINLNQALQRIKPTVREHANTTVPDHLIDDFTLSRNIARFGLHFNTIIDLTRELGITGFPFLWHVYNIPEDEKVEQIDERITNWCNYVAPEPADKQLSLPLSSDRAVGVLAPQA